MVDAVYTWVDGTDGEWRSRRQQDASSSGRTYLAESGIRDNGELRYSIRSLLANMPWIGRIFIVTGNRPPSFIDLDEGRVVIVDQGELTKRYADHAVYNSMAIECCLHRIPELADKFLYMNDDFFVGRPVSLAELEGTHGEGQFLLERKRLDDPKDELYQSYLRSTDRALTRVYGKLERYSAHHVPHLFSRALCFDVERLWIEDVESTARSRFRENHNLLFRMLYAYHVLYINHGVKDVGRIMKEHPHDVRFGCSDEYVWVPFGSGRHDYVSMMSAIRRRTPKFYCIGDEMPDGDVADKVGVMNAFMREMNPLPSPVEKT